MTRLIFSFFSDLSIFSQISQYSISHNWIIVPSTLVSDLVSSLLSPIPIPSLLFTLFVWVGYLCEEFPHVCESRVEEERSREKERVRERERQEIPDACFAKECRVMMLHIRDGWNTPTRPIPRFRLASRSLIVGVLQLDVLFYFARILLGFRGASGVCCGKEERQRWHNRSREEAPLPSSRAMHRAEKRGVK